MAKKINGCETILMPTCTLDKEEQKDCKFNPEKGSACPDCYESEDENCEGTTWCLNFGASDAPLNKIDISISEETIKKSFKTRLHRDPTEEEINTIVGFMEEAGIDVLIELMESNVAANFTT